MTKQIKWNAKYKGGGRAARMLGRFYVNEKLSIFGPLGLGAAMVALFLIFGKNPDKLILVRDSLILAALMYGAVLLVVGMQLLNPRCSPRAMDNFLLFFTAGTAFAVVQLVPRFLLHPRDGFDIGVPGSCTCLSALALIQSWRT